MLTLQVEVAEARDRTAFATLREGLRTVASGAAVASATPAFAARHANPQCDPLRLCGHPPLGRYRLLHHEPAGAGRLAHYGAHLLLFEPQSGPALDAESFGRLGVLVFGGPAGRRTQGGLRVGNEMLSAIVARLSKTGGEGMTLDVVPLRPRAWWQFWKAPQPPSRALVGDALNSPQPPHDELSLLEAMLQKSVRRVRDTAPDRDDAFQSDTRRDTSGTSASGESFQGKGGAYGGAGASGTWSEGSARGRGVDDAGRIIGVAAGVGAVAAAAAMAADGEAAAGASADSGAGGSGADTTTSTAY
jgi:uncharacterized membrane protein YgcG